MAKQFGGFTPEQLGKIDPAMAGMQADEQVKYMAANPGVSSRVGNMAQQAKKRISMANGGVVRAAEGVLQTSGSGRTGVPDWVSPPPEGSTNTQALVELTNPTTGEKYMAPSGGYTLNPKFTKGGGDLVGGPALPKPIIDDPVTTPLYSGPMTAEVSKNILKMSTGQIDADLQYDFNGDGKVTSQDSLAAAKQGVAQGTITTGPDAVGGFADIQYDPTTGLPPAPELTDESINSAVDTAFENPNWNEGTTGVNANIGDDQAWAKTSVTNNAANAVIMADPTDYKLVKVGSYWEVQYSDGTSINTGHRDANMALGRANALAASFKVAAPLVETYAAEEAQYQTNLKQYQTYYGVEAERNTADPSKSLEEQTQALGAAQNLLQTYTKQLASMKEDDPQRATILGFIKEQELKIEQATAGVKQAQSLATDAARAARNARVEAFAKDPTGSVTDAAVVDRIAAEDVAKGEIAALTGDAGEVTDVIGGEVIAEADVADPTAVAANTYTGESVLADTKKELLDVKEADSDGPSQTVVGQTGDISTTSIADEAMQVDTLKILKVKETTDLLVATNQLAEFKGKDYAKVVADVAVSDTLTEAKAQIETVKLNELPTAQVIAEENMAAAKAMQDEGLTSDAIAVAAKLSNFAVTDGTLALAMEGSVQALDTVEGQLSKLMKSFDDGTPSWASGAIRAANAAMAGRGLGASSMASAAILTAAMESALPIAQQDAQVFNNMNLTNLSNRQQVSLSNAAAQQGLSLANLSNQQQANLQKSANAFSLQTQNLSNRQTVELSNAQIRATLQGKNLDNQQQSNIITSARYAEAANINLSNKQQASMQDSMGELQTNLANLSSKSQSYITSANLEANLQGQVLTNDQQVAVLKAARYSESANMTFSADQQRVLHNSSLMQSIGLAELNAQQAAVLQNAANSASMDMADLSNLQQAQVENAKNFLNIDLANLSNEQQTIIFKAQATQQALLSDQASLNSSKQFNAASQNQKDQFDENLKTQVSQFNVEQGNAMERFTVEQGNAISTFNKSQENARAEFNASQALVIEQSNAVWNQSIVTAENAAAVAAAAASAQAANEFSAAAAAADAQAQRDQVSFSFQTANNNADRVTSLAVAQLAKDGDNSAAAATKNAAFASAIGAVAGKILPGIIKKF